MLITAIGVLIVHLTLSIQTELHVGFTELGYYENESEGCLQVGVSRDGELSEDVVVRIHPMTYQQFQDDGLTLPNLQPFNNLPLPAEDGQDFSSAVKTITLHSGTAVEQHQVCIDISPDSVSEADEGFLLVLSVDDEPLSWHAVQSFGSSRVALGIILDDDFVHSCTGVDGRPVCHSKANCHDELEGGVLCECMDGYQGDGVISCTDTNECEDGLDDCSGDIECATTPSGREMCGPVASCVNTDGSYQCTCSSGYIGDGRTCIAIESPIDECVEGTHTCHSNAHCVDTLDGFLCHCNHGYQGDGFECTDVDECVSGGHDCDMAKFCHYSFTRGQLECVHTASCTNTQGRYTCSCTTGFTGDGIKCNDIDECKAVNECSTDAHCRNIPGSYHCMCNEGFQGNGILCTDINECERANRVECGPNAVCKNTPGSFQCVCNDGYQGDGITCTRKQVDECALGIHDCDDLPNTHCVDEEDGYSCVCDSGYTRGDTDQCTDIDECLEATAECSSKADCLNTDGNYECHCHSGYEGDGFTCEDSDECSQGLDSCSSLEECSNTVGSYECQCRPGYQGDGRVCSDVDECALNRDDCEVNAECVNTEGSFDCICRTGFQGNGSNCQDINECEIAGRVECGSSAVCENTSGSFQCVCNDGYQGDGITCTRKPVDECALGIHDCDDLPNTHCVDEEDGYSCVCDSGYTRDDTTDLCRDIDECKQSLHNCAVHAHCINTIGGFHCICKRGYVGIGTSCLPIILYDLCDERTGYIHWIACQKIHQLLMETDYEVLPLFDSLTRDESAQESGRPSPKPWQSNRVLDGDRQTTGIHHEEHTPNSHAYHRQLATKPLQEGQKQTNEQQHLTADSYQDILDSWSVKGQGKSGDSNSVTTGHQHHPHSHTHRNKISHQSTNRWPHPAVKGSKVKGVAGVESNGRSPSLNPFAAGKDDEDVWFSVPGDINVKVSKQ